MMGYYFYYPLKNKICVSRNAEFFENSLMVQKASGSHGLLESSGSNRGLELIQKEDTQPFENTRKVHNEVALIELKPQNVEVPIRRSARIPQALDIYGFYIDVEEYELGDLNEPPHYKAALLDPEFDKWIEAMNTEMQSMKAQHSVNDFIVINIPEEDVEPKQIILDPDDQSIWESAKTVAPTPNSIIIQLDVDETLFLIVLT
nr:hypothetical protein [Tanacetum cinerariifolium]